MLRIQSIWSIPVLILFFALVGCGSNSQFGSQTGNGGNSSVVLAMTDSPPTQVSILAAEVTLTGATLSPGNISVFSGSTTIELTRLQTDIAYIATAANIPAGNYTSLTLTFANPSLTIENDTASPIGNCAVGKICTMPPTVTSNLLTSLPLAGFSVSSSSSAGLLIDVDLDDLLTATMGADFSAGTSVTPFTPAGTGAPLVGAEDVVGQVGSLNASAKTFTLTSATATYSLKADSTSTFFPSGGTCTAQGFACLQNNQILSVDIGMQSDGSILARNVVFEDADNTDTEVEGMVTGINVGSQQFDIVIQTMSAPVSGLSIGQPIIVQYSSSQTPFDVDFVHADNLPVSTAGFVFTRDADLVVGQQVSIQRNSSSSASLIKADRVRLRSTRVTANVQLGPPNILLGNGSLPSLFSGHGVTAITAQTSLTPPTIYYEIGKTINSSDIAIGERVSVRGPLFKGRTLITTKVVVKT